MENIPVQRISNLKGLRKIIDEIKKKGDLIGVITSYRDGNLVSENMGERIDSNTFTAMCASVIASAEALGFTIQNQKFKKIIIELKERNIIIVGASKSLFLILFFDDNSNIEKILNDLEEYSKKINKLN